MEKSTVTSIPQFWQERLAQLRDQPTLCIIGYGFHADYYMPHFSDTISGEWSKSNAKFNPFASESHYFAVMGWASWRKNVIAKFLRPEQDSRDAEKTSKFSTLKSLGQLRELQQLLKLEVVDQSPDGFLKANQIADICEIFGNIHQGKCHACGNLVEQWEFDSSCPEIIKCQSCGGRIFPNIFMFGWNEQIETNVLLTKLLAEAQNLLLIVPDKTLSPFINDNEILRRKRVIELTPHSILLDHGNQTIPLSDISRILGYRLGDLDSLHKSPVVSLSLFSELCAVWKGMPAE